MGWLFSTRKPYNPTVLRQQLRALSQAFPLWVGDGDEFVIVGRVRLPPGFDRSQAELLIELPLDFPLSPPGIGSSHVYVPKTLRFHGRKLEDLHENTTPGFQTPGFGPWAWWCYDQIRWNPLRDDLIKFVEMIRADMTNPPTR